MKKRSTVDPKTLDQHLALARAEIKQRTGFSSQLRRLRNADFLKRESETDKFQEKIQRAGLKAIGLDWNELQNRRVLDYRLALREIEREKKALRAHAQTTRQYHRQRVRQFRQLPKMFNLSAGNPVLLYCQWYADRIVNDPPLTNGNAQVTGVATRSGQFGQNVFQVRMRAASGPVTKSEAELLSHHIFTASARANGFVSVLAATHTLGTVTVAPNGSLCTSLPAASVNIIPWLTVIVSRGNLTGPPVTAYGRPLVLEHRSWGGCTQQVWTGPASPDDSGEVTIQTSHRLPVSQGDLVTANVTTEFRVDSYHGGRAEIDMTGPVYGLNVPSVFFTFES